MAVQIDKMEWVKRIQWERRAQGVWVRLPPQEFIEQLLSYNRRQLVRSAGEDIVGKARYRHFRPMCQDDDDKAVLLPFGFSRILRCLQRAVEQWESLDAKSGVLNSLTCARRASRSSTLTSFTNERRIGIIRYPASRHVSDVIFSIREAQPTTAIAVCTVTHHAVEVIRSNLAGFGVKEVTTGPHARFEEGELRVGTMHDFARHIGKYGLIVFVGPPALRSKHLHLPYSASERARKFLLLPEHSRLAEYEEYLSRCWFGFDELEVGGRGEILRPVSSTWLSVQNRQAQGSTAERACGPRDEAKDRDCEVDRTFRQVRQEIWCNPIRNRRIAGVAKALAGQSSGNQFADILALAPRANADRSVVVYVDSIEHAAVLAGSLKEWPVVCHESVNLAGLGGLRRSLNKHLRQQADDRYRIVSAGGREYVPWGDVDVIIRADGGVGGMPWLIDRLRVCEDACRPLLLVDVRDRGDCYLARRAAQRADAYRQLGWFAPDEDPEIERLTQFLMERLCYAM